MERSRSAFSLIETVIAVGVILTLAALTAGLWPKISNKLVATRALNSLRQLGLAASVYAAENNGTFPGSSHSGNSWIAGLLPYVGLSQTASPDQMKKVYRSPGDPHKTRLYMKSDSESSTQRAGTRPVTSTPSPLVLCRSRRPLPCCRPVRQSPSV
jgi:type II secretory pathway pseudopilin PulG